MPLVLTPEDGTGLADANSYASVAEGDAYAEGHLHAANWTEASAENKAKALVHATRTINALFRFHGSPATATQALDWPRSSGAYPDPVPARLRDATIELAMSLLAGDRTAEPETAGISRLMLGQGAVDITFDKADRPKPLPPIVVAMLATLGYVAGSNRILARVGRAY